MRVSLNFSQNAKSWNLYDLIEKDILEIELTEKQYSVLYNLYHLQKLSHLSNDLLHLEDKFAFFSKKYIIIFECIPKNI